MSKGMTLHLIELIGEFRRARQRHSTKPGTPAILLSLQDWDRLRSEPEAVQHIWIEPRTAGRRSFSSCEIIFAQVTSPTMVWLD